MKIWGPNFSRRVLRGGDVIKEEKLSASFVAEQRLEFLRRSVDPITLKFSPFST